MAAPPPPPPPPPRRVLARRRRTNVRLGESGYGSKRDTGPSGPPPSVTSRWSSSMSLSAFSCLASAAARRAASSSSRAFRLASASAGVGFGNSALGESGSSDMEGSSARRLPENPEVSPSALGTSTLILSFGAGRSAHTSASCPGLPQRAQTAPSRPRGRPFRSPSLGFTGGIRASNGCERCCARFAAVSSR